MYSELREVATVQLSTAQQYSAHLAVVADARLAKRRLALEVALRVHSTRERLGRALFGICVKALYILQCKECAAQGPPHGEVSQEVAPVAGRARYPVHLRFASVLRPRPPRGPTSPRVVRERCECPTERERESAEGCERSRSRESAEREDVGEAEKTRERVGAAHLFETLEAAGVHEDATRHTLELRTFPLRKHTNTSCT